MGTATLSAMTWLERGRRWFLASIPAMFNLSETTRALSQSTGPGVGQRRTTLEAFEALWTQRAKYCSLRKNTPEHSDLRQCRFTPRGAPCHGLSSSSKSQVSVRY